MIDVMFVYEWVILAATVLMCSVMAVMDLANLHRTAPARILPLKHHATKTDLIQGIDIPRGTNHTLPIVVPDMGDISTNHNPPFPLQQVQQFQKAHIVLLIQPPQHLMPCFG